MLFERIRSIIAEQLRIDKEIITKDSNIVEDLGADSLDKIDLLTKMEDEFGIDIPDDKIVAAVGEITNFIASKIGDYTGQKSA